MSFRNRAIRRSDTNSDQGYHDVQREHEIEKQVILRREGVVGYHAWWRQRFSINQKKRSASGLSFVAESVHTLMSAAETGHCSDALEEMVGDTSKATMCSLRVRS